MNNNYKIAINWSDAGNTFLAYAPELSGCIADGNSFSEAIENVQILIDQIIMEELFEAHLPGNPTSLSRLNFHA